MAHFDLKKANFRIFQFYLKKISVSFISKHHNTHAFFSNFNSEFYFDKKFKKKPWGQNDFKKILKLIETSKFQDQFNSETGAENVILVELPGKKLAKRKVNG